MSWTSFDSGSSLGTEGSESGTIVADLEHGLGVRITIERDCAVGPFAITCGVYGWFFHTRFFSTREEADSECLAMRSALDAIMNMIPPPSDRNVDEQTAKVTDAIANFVDTFP